MFQRPILALLLALFPLCLLAADTQACNPQQQIIQQPMAIAQQSYGCYGGQGLSGGCYGNQALGLSQAQVYYQPQQVQALQEDLPDVGGCQDCQQAIVQPLQVQQPVYAVQRQRVLAVQQPVYVQPQRAVFAAQRTVLAVRQPVYAQQLPVQRSVLALQDSGGCYGNGGANQVLAIQGGRQRILGGRHGNGNQAVVLQQSAGYSGGGNTVQTINVGRRGLFRR